MTDNRFSTFDRRILVAAVLCLLIFSYLLYDDRLFMSLFAQHGAVVAEVTQQTEDVRVKFAAGFNWRPALKGQEIYVGDSLFTGDKSGASIKFKDSSSAEVSANSLITFTEANGKYIITLKQGIVLNSQGPIQIVNEVQKRAPASIPSPRPEITSPKTYTKNIIKMNPDDSLDGQQIVDVHWRYDKPLSSFIIEYASDPQFSNIELTQTTEEHHSKSPLLLEGSHFIRVREKDVNNKKMPWSNVVQVEIAISKPEHNKVLSAVQLKDPYIKKAINNPTPIAITWEAIEGAKGYLIEIASTEDLKNSKKIQVAN